MMDFKDDEIRRDEEQRSRRAPSPRASWWTRGGRKRT